MKINQQYLTDLKEGRRAVEHTKKGELAQLKAIFEEIKSFGSTAIQGNLRYWFVLRSSVYCADTLPEGMIPTPLSDFFEPDLSVQVNNDYNDHHEYSPTQMAKSMLVEAMGLTANKRMAILACEWKIKGILNVYEYEPTTTQAGKDYWNDVKKELHLLNQ